MAIIISSFPIILTKTYLLILLEKFSPERHSISDPSLNSSSCFLISTASVLLFVLKTFYQIKQIFLGSLCQDAYIIH